MQTGITLTNLVNNYVAIIYLNWIKENQSILQYCFLKSKTESIQTLELFK